MLKRLLPLLVAVGLLAACSSSGSGHKKDDQATPFAPMVTALGALTSVHLDIDAQSLGGSSATDVALDHGKSTALLIKTNEDGVDVSVLSIGERAWVKLPAPLEAGKPWTVLSAKSSDATVKSLADPLGVVTVTRLLANLDTVGGLIQATDGEVAAQSDTPLDGVNTTKWSFTIDPKKLAKDSDLGQLLTLAGNDAIPTQLWEDDQKRPLRIALDVVVLGQKSTVTIGLSKFDEPLQLAAPEPAQVSAK